LRGRNHLPHVADLASLTDEASESQTRSSGDNGGMNKSPAWFPVSRCRNLFRP
jgi:hypothetical protein